MDWLTVRYRVEPQGAVADEINERQAFANESGMAELRLRRHRFALSRTRRTEFVPFENGEVHGVFDSASSSLEINVRATFLATHTPEQITELVRDIASSFGVWTDEKVGRVDPAADFSDFPLKDGDAHRVVGRARSKKNFLREVSDTSGQPPVREHIKFNRLEGLTVGAKGAPLTLRIYDKSGELLKQGNEEKRAIEHARWLAAGWDGSSPVARVEVQARGVVLDQMHLRDLSTLWEKLDELWQYAVRKWVRLVEPGSATRIERCKLDPRWLAVVDVRFVREAQPGVRIYPVRGGARAAQSFGTLVSFAASRGDLERIDDLELPDCAEDRDGLDASIADIERTKWLYERIRALARNAADKAASQVATDVLSRHGSLKAIVWLQAKVNAGNARFWSADDLSPEVNTP